MQLHTTPMASALALLQALPLLIIIMLVLLLIVAMILTVVIVLIVLVSTLSFVIAGFTPSGRRYGQSTCPFRILWIVLQPG